MGQNPFAGLDFEDDTATKEDAFAGLQFDEQPQDTTPIPTFTESELEKKGLQPEDNGNSLLGQIQEKNRVEGQPQIDLPMGGVRGIKKDFYASPELVESKKQATKNILNNVDEQNQGMELDVLLNPIIPEKPLSEDQKGEIIQFAEKYKEVKPQIDELTIKAEQNPGNIGTWNDLGDINNNIGDKNAALNFYTKANAIKTNWKSLNGMASVYQQDGMDKEARDLWDESIKNNPENTLAWQNRSYLDVKNGNHEEANKDIKKMKEYFPNDSWTWALSAVNKYKQGDKIGGAADEAAYKLKWWRDTMILPESKGIEETEAPKMEEYRQRLDAARSFWETPVNLYGSSGEGALHGLQLIGEGIKAFDTGSPKDDFTGVLKMMTGAAHTTFSGAMLANPPIALAFGALPEEVNKVLMQPVDILMDMSEEEKLMLTQNEQLGLELTNTIGSLAVLGLAHKATSGNKASTKKFMDILQKSATKPETLTQKELKIIKDAVNETTVAQAQKLQAAAEKVPSDIPVETKVKVVPLVAEKDALVARMEKTDEALQPVVQGQIKAIDEQIKTELTPIIEAQAEMDALVKEVQARKQEMAAQDAMKKKVILYNEMLKNKDLDPIEREIIEEKKKLVEEKLTIKSESDAFQKPITEGVDVRQQASNGEKVGEGNTQEKVTEESKEEVDYLSELDRQLKEMDEAETTPAQEVETIAVEEQPTVSGKDAGSGAGGVQQRVGDIDTIGDKQYEIIGFNSDGLPVYAETLVSANKKQSLPAKEAKAEQPTVSGKEEGSGVGDVEAKKQKAFDKFDAPNIQKEVKQTSVILRKVLPTKIGKYVFEKLFSVGGNWHITYRTETERTNINTGEKYTDVSEQSFPLDKEDILNLSETQLLAKIEERANKNGIQGKVEQSLPTKEGTGKEVGSGVKEPMSDNELQQIVGRDVFKQIQRAEEQLGEGVVDRNRMIETAKRIQKADKKDKLLAEHIFEALQYETGYPDNWQDLRNAIKKGGIDINSEAVQRQIEVGVNLPKDIIDAFKKSERYKKASPELVKALEQPTVSGKEVGSGVGGDVPTALKLEGIDNTVLNNISQDNRGAVAFLQSYPENFVGITDIGGGAEKITGVTNKGGAKIEKTKGYSIQLNFKNDRTKVLHFSTEEAKNKAVDKIYEYVRSREMGKGEWDASMGSVKNELDKSKSPTQEAKAEQPTKEVEQQVKDFGVSDEMAKPVTNVVTRVFEGLKKAGLTAAKTVGDWVGIGKGEEKPYTLKINGKDVQVKNVQPEVVNGFYSPLEKIVNDSKFDKLPAKQWIEKYANSEEAKWTGLKDWLAQQQGSVSKADIQQYLKDNRIEVVEVVKGEPQKETILLSKIKWEEVGEDSDLYGDYDYISADGKYRVAEYSDGTKVLFDNEDVSISKIKSIKEDIEVDKDNTDTKFSQYQLEGEKENYKEVLVTMPSKTFTGAELNTLAEKYGLQDKAKELYGVKFNELSGQEKQEVEFQVLYSKNKAKYDQYKSEYSKKIDDTRDKFSSSHFTEPNILVHLRMNTRTDAEGNKVLFLEEIQSDWGQKGKKEGFRGEPLKELPPEAEIGDLGENFDKTDFRYYVKLGNQKISSGRTKSEVIEKAKNYLANEAKQPTAPFVTDTNAWTKLGLKFALREAVKQGADKIAWTTGEQQNDRYDLSKSVSKIEINKKGNNYEVKAYDKGDQVQVTPIKEEIVSEKELEGVVGKEIANKAINEGQTSFEGSELKVGGKGMKGFYGSPTEGSLGIVGNVAKSLFKQEPKTVELQTTSTRIPSQDKVLRFRDWVWKNKTEEYSYSDAQKDIDNNSKLYKEYQKNIPTQHSIDITPEMRKQVETEGQPLFKKGEDEKEFGGFETRDGKPIGYTYDTDQVARQRFDISKLKKIGSGSDRDVYDLGNGKVLKVAKTARGLTQNIYEGDNYLTSVVPEVTERGLNYVVAENAPRIKTSDVVETFDWDGNVTGKATAGEMLKELQKFSQKDFNNHDSKLQDVLAKYGLQDIMSYEVLWNDFIAQRNWGYKEGKAYHSDGGTFGGVDMIDSHKGKTNLSDPEFRKIYEESKRLKKQFGDTDKATMYSKDGGKVEAQYRIESGKNIIEAIEDFDGSPRATVALTHEIMHPTVVAIIDGAKEGNEVGVRHTKTIVDEFNKANPKNQVTVEDLIKGNDAFKDGTTSKQYRAVQEFIAKAWEKYHREGGKGFSKEFQEVLNQITQAFKQVYKSLTGKELTPELRKMFDEILGKEQSLPTKEVKAGPKPEVKTEKGKKSEKLSGKVIEPNKGVIASAAKAIDDVVKELNPDLKPMEATMLHSEIKGKDMSKYTVEYADGESDMNLLKVGDGLKEKIFKKLADKGYVQEFNTNEYAITPKGEEFINRVNARLETRKAVKAGTDLFPNESGIPESELSKKKAAVDKAVEATIKFAKKNKIISDDPTIQKSGFVDLEKAIRFVGEAIKKGIDIHGDVKRAVEEALDRFKQSNFYKKLNPESQAEVEKAIRSEHEPKAAPLGGIKHEETAKVRQMAGMEEYEHGYDTTIEEAQIAAKKWIADGGDVGTIIQKIREGKKINLTESAVIGEYVQSIGARISKEPTPELLAERADLIELIDRAGTTASEEFTGRKLMFPQEDNLANFLYDRSKDKGYELTTEQIKEETTAYKQLKEKQAELEKELEAEKDKYAKLIAEKGINKARAEARKASKKTHEQHVEDRKKIVADMREALKKASAQTYATVPLLPQLRAIAPHIKALAQDIVSEKFDTLDNVVNQIYAEVKDVVDGITKKNIIDSIAGLHDEPQQTKSQKLNQMHLIKREAELLNKLANIRKGIESTPEKELGKKNDRIKELEKQIKDVRRQNKLREEELDEAIHGKGEKATRPKTIEEKLKAREYFLEAKIKQLEYDIKNKKYLIEKEKPKPLPYSRRILDLKDDVINLEKTIQIKRFNDQQNRLAGGKAKQVAKEILGIQRVAQIFLDMSAIGRQLALVTFNPFQAKITGRVLATQLKALNIKKFDRLMDAIHKDEMYHEMRNDGIRYNEINTGSKTSGTINEDYQKSFLYSIPVLKELFTASNRLADAALNTARFELYKQKRSRLEKQGYFRETHPEMYKAMANLVMNETGSGKLLEVLERNPFWSNVAGSTFYGTRLMASRFNTLNPKNYIDWKSLTPLTGKKLKEYDPVKKEAIKDMVGTVTGITAMSLAAIAAGATISLDPDEPDFLQARWGNKVYDFSGGFAAYLRTAFRIVEAAALSAKAVTTSSDSPQKEAAEKEAAAKANFAFQSTTRFFRNKLAPNTSDFTNMFYRKNTIGEPFQFSDFLEMYPMYIDDTYDAIKDEGLTGLATVLAPNLIGLGYGSYASKANIDQKTGRKKGSITYVK